MIWFSSTNSSFFLFVFMKMRMTRYVVSVPSCCSSLVLSAICRNDFNCMAHN